MIAFGFISSESEYHQLDQAQKDHYEEIIIDETVDF